MSKVARSASFDARIVLWSLLTRRSVLSASHSRTCALGLQAAATVWAMDEPTSDHPAAAEAAAQLVEHVAEDGRVIEVVTRAEIRDRALRHRSVYIVVESPDGAVLVHQRADWKDVYPGAWDLAFGGICDPGESWPVAAARELREEAGAVADLVDCGPVTYEAPGVAVLGRLFRAVSTGPFEFNDGEVTDTQWIPRNELAGFVTANTIPEDSASVVLPAILAWERPEG